MNSRSILKGAVNTVFTHNTPASGSVYRIAIIAATAGLLFGFDTAVINGALLSLRGYFSLSDLQVEFAASSLLYGCLLGAMLSGVISDLAGRRPVLRVSGVLFFLSAVLAAICTTFPEFMMARLLGGVGIGLASTIAPLYLAEVSPRHERGRIITLNQIAIVSGILVAYISNWAFSFTGASAWRWMFGAASLPAAAFLFGLRFVPESPRWLIGQNRLPEAHGALITIRGAGENPADFAELQEAIHEEDPGPGWLRRLRRPLLLAVVIAMLQQMSGINAVLYYGSLLFVAHGNSGSNQRAVAANVLIGITNLVFTLVALAIMDKVGRRPLLSGSAVVMFAALLLLVFAFHHAKPSFNLVVGSTLIYVAAFATGLGPGAWVYMAEIFPTSLRGRAMSIATAALWVSCILVSNTFLSLVRALGPSGTFAIFAGVSALAAFFFLWLPETLGKSLEEIDDFWKL